MSISKPDNAHWISSVKRAKEIKAQGHKVAMLWHTHQNVRNRHMAQLARDSGFEPDKEMLKHETKHKLREEPMNDKLKQIVESAKAGKLHPMHIHVRPHSKGKMMVHSMGKKAQSTLGDRLKHGDTVSSSDLDDLSHEGFKVKETK